MELCSLFGHSILSESSICFATWIYDLIFLNTRVIDMRLIKISCKMAVKIFI